MEDWDKGMAARITGLARIPYKCCIGQAGTTLRVNWLPCSREFFEFRDCFALVLRGGVDVAHGHLDLRMACKFPERRKINSSHRHPGECRMAQIVKTELRSDSCPSDRGVVGFADVEDWLYRIEGAGEEPARFAVFHAASQNCQGALGKRDMPRGVAGFT